MLAINTLDADGTPRFIHSGTYEELIDAFGLTPAADRRRDPAPPAMSAMSVPAIHEDDVEALGLPGRRAPLAGRADRGPGRTLFDLRDSGRARRQGAAGALASERRGSDLHHQGSGRVMVGGEVQAVRAGTTVLFPHGVVHMLHNTGSEEMKVVCFFAPPTSLENYRMHEDVDFPA